MKRLILRRKLPPPKPVEVDIDTLKTGDVFIYVKQEWRYESGGWAVQLPTTNWRQFRAGTKVVKKP